VLLEERRHHKGCTSLDHQGGGGSFAKAKQAGKYRGRQSTMTAANVKAIRDRAAIGENKSALAREFGITRQTVYNILSTGS
jgi:DNA invertase Pin-like site-specific DNA recombinase